MSAMGIVLTRLTLIGKDVPDAEVHFNSGLNVISGPSDTGKTFILQCIDYMFGASDPPKEIPESAKYESIVLGVRGEGDTEIIFERSLRGGDIKLRMSGNEDRILGAKHNAGNENTISNFLLNLSGLGGKKVRTNRQGKIRQLSFRDIARLILVDEESVISETSPVVTGNPITKPVESAVFRLLLTGIDDSTVVAVEDKKVAKGRHEGKTEILEDLLEKTQEQIARLKLDGNVATFRDRLDHSESLYDAVSRELAVEQEKVSELEERRRSAWEQLRHSESRIAVLSELQERFELLTKQYSSDLLRLESISEAGKRLGQMKEEHCPICGSLAEHHDKTHIDSHMALDEVSDSCFAEAQKIRTLLLDLQSAKDSNSANIQQLKNDKNSNLAALESIGEQLKDRVQPRVQVALQNLKSSEMQRDVYKRALDLYDRVQEYENLIGMLVKPIKAQAADGPSVMIGAGVSESFSKSVESLLRAWHFPNLDRVTFSDEDQDIVISGRRRASHGKGVRAITHAAFNLSLLQCCRDQSMPHPGLIAIDSPLVVYREPDAGEGNFTLDVKDAFYRSIADKFSNEQIIILENDDPPTIDKGINIIKFTKAEHGRYGFIPIRSNGEGG